MATTNKSEKIFIGIDDQVIELTGKDKEAFLVDQAQIKSEIDLFHKELKKQNESRIAAYTKLGLTEEEINAIL